MRFKIYFCLPFLLFCGTIFSQTKTVQAVKIAQAPKIDGNLNDEAWVNITPATDLIRTYPSAGTAGSEQA